jgi:hypothetical protein
LLEFHGPTNMSEAMSRGPTIAGPVGESSCRVKMTGVALTGTPPVRHARTETALILVRSTRPRSTASPGDMSIARSLAGLRGSPAATTLGCPAAGLPRSTSYRTRRSGT